MCSSYYSSPREWSSTCIKVYLVRYAFVLFTSSVILKFISACKEWNQITSSGSFQFGPRLNKYMLKHSQVLSSLCCVKCIGLTWPYFLCLWFKLSFEFWVKSFEVMNAFYFFFLILELIIYIQLECNSSRAVTCCTESCPFVFSWSSLSKKIFMMEQHFRIMEL